MLGDGAGNLDSPVGHVDQVDPVGIAAVPGFGRAQGALRFAESQRRITGQFLVGLQLVELGAHLFESEVFFGCRRARGEHGQRGNGGELRQCIHCTPSPYVASKSSRRISFCRDSSATFARITAVFDFSMASSELISDCSIR